MAIIPPVNRSSTSTYLFKTVLDVFICKRCSTYEYFSPDSDKTTFLLKEAILCIEDSYFSWKQQFKVLKCLDCFIINTTFTLQYVNWWTAIVWITCGLLFCFYQLFGLSYWWQPLPANDPLVSKWKTHLHFGWPEGKYIFSKFPTLGELFLSFKM